MVRIAVFQTAYGDSSSSTRTKEHYMAKRKKAPVGTMECLVYTNYEVYETQQSLIDPDISIMIFKGWKCPQCKHLHPNKSRHEVLEVCGCGLRTYRVYNELHCEVKKP